MATLMIDTIHQTAGNIPAGTPKVAGYVTGTPEIRWTQADWGRFPHAGQITIDQGHGTDIHAAKVLDVEQGAATPAEAARWAHERKAAGIGFSDIYISASRIPDLLAQLHDLGPAEWFVGHVRLWVANWSLNQAEATAILGTELFGLRVAAVQWASPSSNPTLRVPGSQMTLRQANVDLSITEDSWHAAPGTQPPAPTPAPHPIQRGMLVTEHDTDLVGRAVTSHDGGKTWII